MLTLQNGDSSLEWVRALWAQRPGIREREETVEGHGGVTTDTSQEAFEKPLALPILVQYQSSAMWTEKLSRGRSVESFSQVKHGNISFLLTQESGSHLCEVALSFSREPPAIWFSRVRPTWWWTMTKVKYVVSELLHMRWVFWHYIALRVVVS